LAARPPMKEVTEKGARILPRDPRAAEIAKEIERRMGNVHKAEQRLPMPPEKLPDYFPHVFRDELRPAVVKAIRQDAYKMLTKEFSAGLDSSKRRTYEGLVDELTVKDL